MLQHLLQKPYLTFCLAALAVFADLLGLFMIKPVIGPVIESLNTTASSASALSTSTYIGIYFFVGAICEAVTPPFIGRLGDQIGFAPILAALTVGSGVLYIIQGWVSGTSVDILITLSAITGLFSNAMPIGRAMLASAAKDLRQSAVLLGYFSAVNKILAIVGPALGIFVASSAGYVWAFYVPGLLTMFLLILFLTYCRCTRTHLWGHLTRSVPSSKVSKQADVIDTVKIFQLCFVCFLCFGSAWADMTVTPFVLLKSFHLSFAQTGVFLGVQACIVLVCQLFLWPWLLLRFGVRPLTTIGFWCAPLGSLIAMLSGPVSGYSSGPIPFTLGLYGYILYSSFFNVMLLAIPGVLSIIAAEAKHKRGFVFGLNSAIAAIFRGVAPLVVMVLLDHGVFYSYLFLMISQLTMALVLHACLWHPSSCRTQNAS